MFGGAPPSWVAGGTPSLAAGWAAALAAALSAFSADRSHSAWAHLLFLQTGLWLLLPQLVASSGLKPTEVGLGHSQTTYGRDEGLRHIFIALLPTP